MKTKKLTLDETWVLCLSMWRWIAEQKRAGNTIGIDILKSDWLDKNWAGKEIRSDCFFCDWAIRHAKRVKPESGGCPDCPGVFVDRQFDCADKNYNFFSKPIAFYNKFVSLNRKRLKAKDC